jgi:putative flippase GtrA
MIQIFIKYGVVGFSGFCLDFSVTIFLKERVKLHRYLSNSIGFTVAASSNWFLNRIWTFWE